MKMPDNCKLLCNIPRNISVSISLTCTLQFRTILILIYFFETVYFNNK